MTINNTTSPLLNKLKWLFTLALLTIGLVANYYFQEINVSLRVIGWIILVSMALLVASMTSQGKRTINFSKDARAELRRVVWPSRQETVRTSIMVLMMILVVGLILWGIDSILLWAVSLVTR